MLLIENRAKSIESIFTENRRIVESMTIFDLIVDPLHIFIIQFKREQIDVFPSIDVPSRIWE